MTRLLRLAAAFTIVVSAGTAFAQPGREVVRGGALPGPLPIFPADNWWNVDISQAPLDPRSDAYIQFVGTTRRLHPDFGNESGDTLPNPIIYGMPYVVVSGAEPLEPVSFYYEDESDAGAPGRPPGYPIPVEARTDPRWIEGGVPGGGDDGDRHLLIVDRDNRLLYELYALRWNAVARQWEAGSGAVFPLDSNQRRPEGWTSADAAGLAILPGLIRYDEAFGTEPIRHAFRVTVRATNGYVYPASHRAGSNSSALPMGARLRLKASKDLSRYPAALRRVFDAMKTYGLIVADNGSDMYITGTYDPRWDMDPFVSAFRTLTAADFEVVQLGWQPEETPAPTDVDDDGLPDEWERLAGLDPASRLGADGAGGDPDGDGLTNAQELAGASHPRGVPQRFFAEGVTSTFFSTRFALFNVTDAGQSVLLRFERGDGSVVTTWRQLSAFERQTLDVGSIPGLDHAEFATRVEAAVPVVVDRTVTWDPDRYGAHTDAGVRVPAQRWFLAEGATHSGFDLFYLVENPADASAIVAVDFLRPGGLPVITRGYDVPPHSRYTIWVNQVDAALAATDVSAVVSTTSPGGIVVERAMYLSRDGRLFAAGHAAAGVPAPAPRWFLAEGATGPLFDEFVLLANPNDHAVTVDLQFLLPDGRVRTSGRTLPPWSRETVWVNLETPELGATSVSVVAHARDGDIVVERAMWWPTGAPWIEAHVATGSLEDGTAWAVADGDATNGASSYVLVANVSDVPGTVRLTTSFEGGGQGTVTKRLPPHSRTTFDVSAEVGGAAGRRFGVLVESLGDPPARIVVEHACYWDSLGEFWGAGSAAGATRIR